MHRDAFAKNVGLAFKRIENPCLVDVLLRLANGGLSR